MKKILFTSLLICLLAGCAHKGSAVLEKEPCDAVANREKKFVCGKDRVRDDCNPVLNEPSLNVCHEL